MRNISLTEGNVRKILIDLTGPMIFGMLGLIIFNLVDTFYVSILGTEELAALSFTYPVVLILNSISLGIGMGTASVVSRAAGEKNVEKIRQYATDSLSLGVIIVFIFMIVGLNTIEPVFKLLGANETVMPIIISYMRIWYIGTMFVVIPMIGNNSIRALGDTKIPSIIMMVAAVVNTILDPILIFGWGPFPRLEVPGAAIATVFSRMITFSVAIYVLGYRDKIISFKGMSKNSVFESWKKILYIGAPNALVKMIQPLGVGMITRLLASISIEAVAGFGIAAKVERFAIIIIGALSVVMVPFIGQNYGGKFYDRIKESLKNSYYISFASSIFVYAVLLVFSNLIAGVFSDNLEVINVFNSYIKVVPLFYGFYGIQLIGNSFFNAINKPFEATMITALQMFIIFVPLSLLLANILGYLGIFVSLGISFMLAGIVAFLLMNKKLKEWYK
ncbi:MAG: MATE family efflux transporter [Clostridiales bacterium]|nr:MATE family efflux transporter [Clostridiales bacterium]